jgi:hypothetical protein
MIFLKMNAKKKSTCTRQSRHALDSGVARTSFCPREQMSDGKPKTIQNMLRVTPLLVLLALGLSGCTSVYRTVAVNNVSSGMIKDFRLKTVSGGFDVRYGYVPVNPTPEIPGATFQSDMRITRNDICIATWVDASGQKRGSELDLSKQPHLGAGRGLLFKVHDEEKITVKAFKD